MKYCFLFAFFFHCHLGINAQVSKSGNAGKLFIIGGGEKSKELMRDLITTSSMRKNDFIAILPMSSVEPDSSFFYISEDFKMVTDLPVLNFNFEEGKQADPKKLDSLRSARIIFITGGDQVRFMKVVLNTPIYDAIHEAFNKGSTIAGTSAGAAVMSRNMITGNSLTGDTSYHETFSKLQKGNLEIKEGLGFLDSVIVDQHFIVRSRYNRLLTAMAEFPNYTCIGIDESTAIVVSAQRVKKTRKGQVILFRRPANIKYTSTGLIKFSDLQFSVYTSGDEFNIPIREKKKPM